MHPDDKVALINIWDDYYDDGFVPAGKKQETHIYVENIDLPPSEAKAILDFLLTELQAMKRFSSTTFTMAKYKNGDPKIRAVDLSHAQREKLLAALVKKKTLSFDGWTFSFASES